MVVLSTLQALCQLILEWKKLHETIGSIKYLFTSITTPHTSVTILVEDTQTSMVTRIQTIQAITRVEFI